MDLSVEWNRHSNQYLAGFPCLCWIIMFSIHILEDIVPKVYTSEKSLPYPKLWVITLKNYKVNIFIIEAKKWLYKLVFLCITYLIVDGYNNLVDTHF